MHSPTLIQARREGKRRSSDNRKEFAEEFTTCKVSSITKSRNTGTKHKISLIIPSNDNQMMVGFTTNTREHSLKYKDPLKEARNDMYLLVRILEMR